MKIIYKGKEGGDNKKSVDIATTNIVVIIFTERITTREFELTEFK